MSGKVEQSRTMSSIVEQSRAKPNKVEQRPVKLNKVENGHRSTQKVEFRHRSTEKSNTDIVRPFRSNHESSTSVRGAICCSDLVVGVQTLDPYPEIILENQNAETCTYAAVEIHG